MQWLECALEQIPCPRNVTLYLFLNMVLTLHILREWKKVDEDLINKIKKFKKIMGIFGLF